MHAALGREGIPAYLPLVRQWPRPAVGGDVVPMFPGYVFCQPAAAQIDRVAATNGVAGFVRFGDGPASVRPEVIGYLRARASSDGIIHLDPSFNGREVTIVDGPLRGLSAVIRAAHDRPPTRPRPARSAPTPDPRGAPGSVASTRMTPRLHLLQRLHLRTGHSDYR